MDVVQLKQYIINNNDKIKDILTQLGCTDIADYTKEYRACTSNCTTKNRNIVVNKSTLSSRIYTMSETKQGDLLSIVMNLNNLGFVDALKFTCKVLGLSYDYVYQPKIITKELCSIFKDAIKNTYCVDVKDLPTTQLDIVGDYMPILTKSWVNEGITEKTRKEFDIGYSQQHKGIIIPHRYWANGEIIGIIRRTTIPNYELFGIAKYFPIMSYPKGFNLYGYTQNYKSIQEAGEVWVYEAEKSVLKRHSRLDGRGVAVCCHELTKEQISILLGLNVDIVISFDTDIPLQHILATCERLWKYRTVYFTYDFLNILPEKSSLADLDNETFKYYESQKVLYDTNWHNKYIKMLETK